MFFRAAVQAIALLVTTRAEGLVRTGAPVANMLQDDMVARDIERGGTVQKKVRSVQLVC